MSDCGPGPAGDLAGVGEGLLDSPPCDVAGHQIFRGRFQIGGDQRKSITAVVTAPSPGLVVAHQNHPHGSAAKRPYQRQTRSVICTVSVRPYRRTWVVRQAFVVLARAATSAGVPNRAPRVRGRPERPVRGGGSSCSTEVTFNRLVQLIRPSTSRRRFPDVGGVADHVHDPVGVAGGDQLGQLAGVRDLPGVPGSPQSGQHRQAHRAGQKRQLHHDAGHDPAVAEPDGFRALRGAVVMLGRPETFLPDRLNNVSSTATVSAESAGSSRATIRSARANPSASPDQRAVVNNRCARL